MAIEITGTEPGSIARKLNIKPGSRLLSINGNAVNDLLDYGFYAAEEQLTVVIQAPGEMPRSYELEKEPDEELGFLAAEFLMDEQHSCQNKCIFCFIDQLPNGLRESLYFKDDDERLSFLFGNYITLTNLGDAEIERIIDMHISPINVSVHTTEPALRCAVMGNRFAGQKLAYLNRLAEAGVALNCQVVLCRGVNDGAHLEKTLGDLAALGTAVRSIAVVPAGLTAHRAGLAELTPYDKASAAAVLDAVLAFGERCLSARGERLAYPADEWFLLAGRAVPPLEFYGELRQLENGVGMLALLRAEFVAALAEKRPARRRHAVDIVTGEAAAPFLKEMFAAASRALETIDITVHAIKNEFLGGNVSVAGLLSGGDIMRQLTPGDVAGERLLLPRAALRAEGDLMLDDVTPRELEAYYKKPIVFCASGGELLDALLSR